MATASRRSNGSVLSTSFRRSISPSGGRFAAVSSSAFASSTASPSAARSFFQDHHNSHHRSASPTRVTISSAAAAPPSAVRFSLTVSDSIRSTSAPSTPSSSGAGNRRTCMCSPTTHPGSFRCSLHKGVRDPHGRMHQAAISSSSNRLYAQRSAMKNSLVRIGAVEGDWVKRALAALIRPSSHQQRRRTDFCRRPSRLSVMSMATGDDFVS